MSVFSLAFPIANRRHEVFQPAPPGSRCDRKNETSKRRTQSPKANGRQEKSPSCSQHSAIPLLNARVFGSGC